MVTLSLYRIKDEMGESLIFQLTYTKSGESIIRFGIDQIIKFIGNDIMKQKATFFVIDEHEVPKPGEKVNRNILERCLKVFINDGSPKSLEQMLSHMNAFYSQKKEKQANKENDRSSSNSRLPTPQTQPKNRVKNLNLSGDLQKMNRKRQLRALMYANPKKVSQNLRVLNQKKQMKNSKDLPERNEEQKVS